MSLAVYMMIATIGIFWLGAAIGIWWSVAAGQWHGLAEGARMILDDEEQGARTCL